MKNKITRTETTGQSTVIAGMCHLVKLQSVIISIITLLSIPADSPASGRVLWDISHGALMNWTPDGHYRLLADILADAGYRVTSGDIPLSNRGLFDSDILVVSILSNYENNYSAAELAHINNFVRGGGGLILLADNNAVRPALLAPLFQNFGFVASRDDAIGNLTDMRNHPILADVGRVVFSSGSAVGALPDRGTTLIAFDAAGRAGIAVNSSLGGNIVLIGDADLWSNDMLGEADNLELALNIFKWANREVTGSFSCEFESRNVYLPQGISGVWEGYVINDGEGFLEFDCRYPDDIEWLTVEPALGLVAPNRSQTIRGSYSTAGLNVGEVYSTDLVVGSNDIHQEDYSVNFTIHVVSRLPEYFDVPPPTGSDHSLLIQRIYLDGRDCPTGAEVGVFAPDGFCAGGAVYFGQQFGIAARADDPMTGNVDGFRFGQQFTFRAYLPWSGEEVGAVADFTFGPQNFANDGFSVLELDLNRVSEVTLILNNRWNWVSLNLTPYSMDFEDIFSPLQREGLIVLVKDGAGLFWYPAWNFSNLGLWDVRHGYAVMVAQPTSITLQGVEVNTATLIPLNEGWNLIAYLPKQNQSLGRAFENLGNNLRFVKQDDGNFWSRDWEWDGIGILEPGEAYQLNIDTPDTLIYPESIQELAGVSKPKVMFDPAPGGIDMSLLLYGLQPKSEIRITDLNGVVCGRGLTGIDGAIGLPIWGDNPLTSFREGLINGEYFVVQVLENSVWSNVDIKWLEGEPLYADNGFAVGKINSQLPDEFGFTVFPNPFNDQFGIKIGNAISTDLSLTIFDIEGRQIDKVRIQKQQGSTYSPSIPAKHLPSGILILRFDYESGVKIVKTLHLP